MSQGVNYNLISPFGNFGGSASNPAFPVAAGTGWFYDSTNQSLGAAVASSEVAQIAQIQPLASGFTAGALYIGLPGTTTQGFYLSTQSGVGSRAAFINQANNTYAAVLSGGFISNSLAAALQNLSGTAYIGFANNGVQIVGAGSASLTLNVGSTGQTNFAVPIVSYATTSAPLGLGDTNGYLFFNQSGATTVNVTLPTTVPGLKYTVGNFVSGATVIISPKAAADTLLMSRGFTTTAKAAGASTVSGLQFSSITFVCVTTSAWFVTELTGTWL